MLSFTVFTDEIVTLKIISTSLKSNLIFIVPIDTIHKVRPVQEIGRKHIFFLFNVLKPPKCLCMFGQ